MRLRYKIYDKDSSLAEEDLIEEESYDFISRNASIRMMKTWDHYNMGHRILLYSNDILFYDTQHPIRSFFGALKEVTK